RDVTRRGRARTGGRPATAGPPFASAPGAVPKTPSPTRSVNVSDCLPELARELGEDRVERGVPLAPLTTFRIGGPADFLFRARTADELAHSIVVARSLGIPHFLLGKGANILVGDAGFRGLVIRCEVGGIEFLQD